MIVQDEAAAGGKEKLKACPYEKWSVFSIIVSQTSLLNLSALVHCLTTPQ